jgi:hypothetical protein
MLSCLLKKALSTIKQTNIKIENKCNNVYFRAVMYRQKYLTNDRFDNFYLTYKLLEVDVRRQKMGHVEVGFIGGGNRSTRTKSLTCRKSLTNFIT